MLIMPQIEKYAKTEKLTPTATVRAHCKHCLGLPQFNKESVKDCQGDTAYNGACPFFPYRLGKRIPVKVFRAFCLQCMGGNRELVMECETTSCPIQPYRFGKNPALIGKRKASKKAIEALQNFHQKASDDMKSSQESTFTSRSIEEYAFGDVSGFRA